MSLKLLLAFCLTIAICFGDRHKGKGKHFFGCKGCCVVWPGPAIGRKCIFPFTWKDKTYNSCAFEPSQGDKYPWCSTKVDSNGNHVSGQRQWGKCGKGCSEIPPPTDECIKMNVNYGGNDISGGLSKQSTWEECQTQCGTNADCLYWTFRTSDGNCWLKSANDVKTVENGMVSGPRECPGSCSSCPKPGVDGGYMEYSQVQEKLAEIWANTTEVSNEVQENALAIETKCPKDKCEEIEANTAKIEESLDKLKSDNITALEEKVAVLMEQIVNLTTKVSANEAALSDKCDATKCTTIETNLTKVESCLGDVTSTDCPTISGKTGVVASISTNTAALQEKCDVANCTAIKTDIDSVESCLADKSSGTCPAAPTGKVSVTDAITSLETPPLFNCIFNNGDVATTVDVLSPYTCDINEDNVVDATTGKFTVAKAGKYRLTFMALNVPLKKKKVICLLVKTSSGTETKIARSVAQSMIGDEEEKITATIDIIHDLKLGDIIHMNIIVKVGTKIVGVAADKPQQVTFTGEFLRE